MAVAGAASKSTAAADSAGGALGGLSAPMAVAVVFVMGLVAASVAGYGPISYPGSRPSPGDPGGGTAMTMSELVSAVESGIMGEEGSATVRDTVTSLEMDEYFSAVYFSSAPGVEVYLYGVSEDDISPGGPITAMIYFGIEDGEAYYILAAVY